MEKLETEIKRVKVYKKVAQIFRQGAIKLSPGKHKLEVAGLSESLDVDSLQVEGVGGGMIVAYSCAKSAPSVKSEPEHVAELRRELDQANKERLEIEDQLMIWNSKLPLLDKFMQYCFGPNNKEFMSVERLEEMEAYFFDKKTAVAKEARKLETEMADKQALIEELKTKIKINGAAGGEESPMTFSALIDYETDEAVELTVYLTYFVKNASWSPKYVVRASEERDQSEFALYASVYNNTGVDWRETRLELSNAAPRRIGATPELQPWTDLLTKTEADKWEEDLEEKTPSPQSDKPRRSRVRKSRRMAAQMEPPGSRSSAPDEKTTVKENELAVEYAVDLDFNLPSDGQPRDFKLHTYPNSVKVTRFAAPKLSKQAYLNLELSVEDASGMPGAPARIYFDGIFAGKMDIRELSAGKSLNIGLGAIEQVFIQRFVKKDLSKGSLFKKKKKLEVSYKILIANKRRNPLSLRVVDQAPQSSELSELYERQEIQPEFKLLETSGAEYDEKTGQLAWQVELAPGEQREIEFGFELEVPEGWEVNDFTDF